MQMTELGPNDPRAVRLTKKQIAKRRSKMTSTERKQEDDLIAFLRSKKILPTESL